MFQTSSGRPQPPGATVFAKGVYFSFAADAFHAPPNTFTPAGNEVAITSATYWANPKSIVILVSKASY